MHAVVQRLAEHGDISIDEPVDEDPRFALRITPGLTGRFTMTSNPASRAGPTNA
jgi:hypothetical protein